MPATMPSRRLVRLWVWLGCAGLGVGVLILGLLHVVGPTADISPLRRTISEYQLTELGWAFNLGVLAIALGSVALLLALVGARLTGTVGGVLLGGWIAGLLVLTAFPKHNWAIGPSVTGQVHRLASLVAFLCLPLAVLYIAGRRRSGLDGPAVHASARWTAIGLAAGALLWFVPILLAIAGHASGGRPWWQSIPLGLIERGLALTEVLALTALGVSVLGVSVPGTARPVDPGPTARVLASEAGPSHPS